MPFLNGIRTLGPGGFATNTPASVTVNGKAGTFSGTTFAAPGVTLSNGPNTFTAIAEDIYGRKATNILTANYPATLTASNDANGNLLSDGKRAFEYDAENRLTNFYVASAWRTTLAYDGLSRMRIRREYTWTNSAWKLTNEVRLIYDGLLVLQERDSNNIPKVTYTRGVDLSGSFQGAGGIGGMLGMTTHASTTNYTHYFYHSDGAGNITALMDTNQVVQAQYAYEPFGNLCSQSGALTNLSRYRSSSKEWHPQSDMYFYPFRIYAPDFQRWLTEDPIGIVGGVNLKRFVGNNPMCRIDPFGLAWYDWLNPFSYSSGYAGVAGGYALDAQAKAHGYSSYGDALDHLNEALSERVTVPDDPYLDQRLALDSIQAVGDTAAAATELYLAAATSVTPTAAGSECLTLAAENSSKLLGPGTQFGAKIDSQLAKRGWTKSLVEGTISDPARIVATRDTRYLAGGGRLDDPATAFFNRRGGYVVRNDMTGDIVQVSNRLDPNWNDPF